MEDFIVIKAKEKYEFNKINNLLLSKGIKADKNLDYSCYISNKNMDIIATGSLYKNTIRCVAVDSNYNGMGLLNSIISHLINVQMYRGNTHIFVYTKCDSAKFFIDLGFCEITQVENKLSFLENIRHGFSSYINVLKTESHPTEGKIGAIIMNANPFTKGHRYLVEKASKNLDLLHLFIVSDDSSVIPYNIRKKLVIESTADIKNIVYHDTGNYIISSSSFPSYFQKDENSVIESQALLDSNIFFKIADELSIKYRYVGEEPYSTVTKIYNDVMKKELPKHNIELNIIKRKESEEKAISASDAREYIKSGDFKKLSKILTKASFDFFTSDKANEIINKIKDSDNLRHY